MISKGAYWSFQARLALPSMRLRLFWIRWPSGLVLQGAGLGIGEEDWSPEALISPMEVVIRIHRIDLMRLHYAPTSAMLMLYEW